MHVANQKTQLILSMALLTLLLATRGYHFASAFSLPSASWAVFFLAGFYLRTVWFFYLLFFVCVGIDLYGNITSNSPLLCLTPAYSLLLPAYGVLWMAGRYANQQRQKGRYVWPLISSVLLSAMLSEIISSGGYYLFSGHFAEPTFQEFAARLTKFFPQQFANLVFWLAITALVHGLLTYRYSAKSAKV